MCQKGESSAPSTGRDNSTWCGIWRGFSHVLLSCLHPRSCFAEYRLFRGILGMQLLMFFPQNATLLGDNNHNHSKMLIICCCKLFNIILVQLTLLQSTVFIEYIYHFLPMPNDVLQCYKYCFLHSPLFSLLIFLILFHCIVFDGA